MHADMLRQKLQEAQAQLQGAQQTAEQATQAQAAHDQQIQLMQQQIADATQQSTQASDQVLQNQQAAAAMRMAFQQLRGQVLQLAASDPPMMSSDAQALLASQQPPPGQGDMSGQPTGGPAGPPQAGAAGTAPGAAPPSGEADMNQPAAGGATGPETAKPAAEKETKEPESKSEDNKGSSPVSVKVGHARRALQEAAAELLPFVGKGKTAAIKDFFAGKARAGLAVLPHAAVGAGLGAGLGAAESYTSNEPLRQKVQGLEAQTDRGFGDTMNLAQSKARLTMGDFAQKHPKTMMGMGALAGAATGAAEGPGLVSAAREGAGHVKNIGKHLKTLMKGAA
jgi:hypothetical protein